MKMFARTTNIGNVGSLRSCFSIGWSPPQRLIFLRGCSGRDEAMTDEGAEAIVGLEVPSIFSIAKTVAELATARRMPTDVLGRAGGRWWSDVLGHEFHLDISATSNLCRSDSQGRQGRGHGH